MHPETFPPVNQAERPAVAQQPRCSSSVCVRVLVPTMLTTSLCLHEGNSDGSRSARQPRFYTKPAFKTHLKHILHSSHILKLRGFFFIVSAATVTIRMFCCSWKKLETAETLLSADLSPVQVTCCTLCSC